ncbi:sialomucin core protein 24-like [Monodon monoceros]|uniref:sialomucin core protein 24-like n=1 Tax=Monodon monoceros TaxID=40151 RepID=UPI0010F854DE|nr:sialomucin core protein 24-like [Monodon monoceros]
MPGLRRPRLSAASCLAALCGMSAAHTTTLASSATTLAALPTITSTASAPPPPLPPGTTPAPEICESHSTVFPVLAANAANAPRLGSECKGKSYCSDNPTVRDGKGVNSTEFCPGLPATPLPTKSAAKTTTPPSPSTACTTATTSGTTDTTSTPASQPVRKSTFGAASFVEGTVLVLGVQAVIFFLYQFRKSKERNYRTL